MPQPSHDSIGHRSVVDQPSLPRRMRRMLAAELTHLDAVITRSAAACDADRYRKHFTAVAHATLLLFHGLSGQPSLRRSYAAISTSPGLLERVGLRAPDGERLTVSYSQFAASNTSRPAAFLDGVLADLQRRVRALGPRQRNAPPAELTVLDTTFLRLSVAAAPWLPTRRHRGHSGVQVLVRYTPAVEVPEHVVISDTRTNDVQRLDAAILDDPLQLERLAGHTLSMDLGFYSHARFARLRHAGVAFVSRLHQQAQYTVQAERPVQAELAGLPTPRIHLMRDAAITLGSPNNRAGAVLPGMRLVEAVVAPQARAARRGDAPVTYTLITDRWDLSAAEVVQFYLWRWEIEVFFRWLKRILGVLRLLGTSRNAVELSVAVALIAHLLLVLLAAALGASSFSVALLALLPGVLTWLTADDAPALGAASFQLALPGCSPPSHAPP